MAPSSEHDHRLLDEKSTLEGASREILYWNIGHGRVPLHDDEHAYAIDMIAREHKRTRRLHHFVILSLLLAFIYFWRLPAWLLFRGEIEHDASGTVPSGLAAFNWSALPPSKELNWTECYDIFQCARLAVPLLYSESSGEEAAVALIKHPSIYPPDHEKYRGPILFNPGGPGGSGVALIWMLWPGFRRILGDEFDLVGFDPRGVGLTTPALSVFQEQVEAAKFYLQFPLNLNSSSSALGEAHGRANIMANIVQDRAQFVAERVSTPIVARDMLSIVKAFGQDKLQYWGFSYGTILGATFAAMFPDNVGRLVIDGVVDTEDYYNGLWANNLRDTDAALLDIYQACVSAGPSKCPLYEKNVSLVKARVDRLLEQLKTEPVAFYSNQTFLGSAYDVVDYGSVKSMIFMTLYNTHGAGARLMQVLADLEQGDPFWAALSSLRTMYNDLIRCTCPASPSHEMLAVIQGPELSWSIACGDRVESRQEDLNSLRGVYEDMATMSSFADTWAPRVLCSSWKLTAKEGLNASFEQTTSHPLLIIGNTADPVTPLWNAHKVSKGFKDSVVLTQNSSGHCSIAATSLCTFKAIHEYFVNGTLPEKGTVCETVSSIFREKAFNLDSLSEEDRELVAASDMLRENYFVPPFGVNPSRLL